MEERPREEREGNGREGSDSLQANLVSSLAQTDVIYTIEGPFGGL